MNLMKGVPTISAIRKYSRSFNSFGNDYILFHLDNGRIASELNGAFRIDGVALFWCVKGTSLIKINFTETELKPGSLLVLDPDTLIEVVNSDNADFECYALFLSPEFINNISLDMNAFDYRRLIESRQMPVVDLTESQQSLLGRYFGLISVYAIDGVSNIYTRNIARSLIAALLYQVFAFSVERSDGNGREEETSTRRSIYVRQFLELLRENFRKERTINFYAGKLFISPKYLSMVLKESTGASATEWIDRYVVMEAKNLLRYSGKNVQQIAYELNFANQSSFGKYFKLQTGQSPTTFRKK